MSRNLWPTYHWNWEDYEPPRCIECERALRADDPRTKWTANENPICDACIDKYAFVECPIMRCGLYVQTIEEHLSERHDWTPWRINRHVEAVEAKR